MLCLLEREQKTERYQQEVDNTPSIRLNSVLLIVNICPPKSNTKLFWCSLYCSPAPQIRLAVPCPATSQSCSSHINTDGDLSQPQNREPGSVQVHHSHSCVHSFYFWPSFSIKCKHIPMAANLTWGCSGWWCIHGNSCHDGRYPDKTGGRQRAKSVLMKTPGSWIHLIAPSSSSSSDTSVVVAMMMKTLPLTQRNTLGCYSPTAAYLVAMVTLPFFCMTSRSEALPFTLGKQLSQSECSAWRLPRNPLVWKNHNYQNLYLSC